MVRYIMAGSGWLIVMLISADKSPLAAAVGAVGLLIAAALWREKLDSWGGDE